MKEVIVVTTKFYTDGDFRINADSAGLVSGIDGYDYCGTFLCEGTCDAETVLERIFKSVEADGLIFQWLIQAFGEAFTVLRENPESLQYGWCASMGGNYEGTHLFMQTIQVSVDDARNLQAL